MEYVREAIIKKIKYITIDPDGKNTRESKRIRLSKLNLHLCPDKKISYEIMKIIRATTVLTINNRKVRYQLNPENVEFSKLDDSRIAERSFNRIDMQFYSEELQEYLSVNHLAESVNYFHPVIQFILRSLSDKYKWFRWAVFFIARDIAMDLDFDEKKPESWGDRTIRNVEIAISHLKKVDWNEIPDPIKPPFKIYYPRSGNVHEITLEYLIDLLVESGGSLDSEKPESIDIS